jgi:MFS family permease
MTNAPRKTFPLLCLMLFALLLSTGTQFPTLNPFGESLQATAAQVGWLWFWFAAPRAFMGPLWASLSDAWGRRPIFILGSIGMVGGSILWALSTSFEMLVTSRVIDSALSAQAAVAFAVVADITPAEKRSSAMGLLGMTASLAFIIGPVFGAIFAAEFGLASIGWLNAGLQGFALLLAIALLPETAPPRTGSRLAVPLFQSQSWHRLTASPVLPLILATVLIFTISYTQFNTAFQLITAKLFDFDERSVGYAWMILGLCAAISQGGLIRQLAPRLGEANVAGIGMIGTAIGFILMAMVPAPLMYWVATAILGLGVGLTLAALNALVSLNVSPADQGIMQGFNQAAQQIGRSIGPLMGSAGVAILGPPWPFVIAAAIAAFSLVGIALILRGTAGTAGTTRT